MISYLNRATGNPKVRIFFYSPINNRPILWWGSLTGLEERPFRLSDGSVNRIKSRVRMEVIKSRVIHHTSLMVKVIRRQAQLKSANTDSLWEFLKTDECIAQARNTPIAMATCAVEGGCATDYVAIIVSVFSMIL